MRDKNWIERVTHGFVGLLVVLVVGCLGFFVGVFENGFGDGCFVFAVLIPFLFIVGEYYFTIVFPFPFFSSASLLLVSFPVSGESVSIGVVFSFCFLEVDVLKKLVMGLVLFVVGLLFCLLLVWCCYCCYCCYFYWYCCCCSCWLGCCCWQVQETICHGFSQELP